MSNKELTRLIILGAGASVDCGVYPTGEQFIEIVKKIIPLCDLDDDSNFKNPLVQEWIKSDEIPGAKKSEIVFCIKNLVHNAMQNLVDSSHASIDAHVAYIDDEAEKKFLKSLILSMVLASTAYSDLRKNFDNNWYFELSKLIFPTLSSSMDERRKLEGIKDKLNFLKIVTFNYDVSLELYLLKRVKNFFKKNDRNYQDNVSRASEAIMQKIHHVYGQIAGLKDNKIDCEEILEVDPEFKKRECNGMNFSRSLYYWKDSFGKMASDRVRGIKVLSSEEFTKSERLSGKFFQTFGDLLKHDDSVHFKVFSFLIFRNALKIFQQGSDKNELSAERVSVIGEDRNDPEMDKILSEKIIGKKINFDLLYVLGYGFDRDNNKKLGIDKINWQRGCVVTNFASRESDNKVFINEKLQRMIYDELSRVVCGTTINRIPLISDKSVSNALRTDFSFFEEFKIPMTVTTNRNIYLEMREKN